MIGEATRDLVFYDGACGLCHHAVRFLLVRDRKGTLFLFAPLGGSTFSDRIDEAARATLPDSIVVLTNDGNVLVRSGAVIHLLRRIGSAWGLLSLVFGWIPPGMLDRAYDLVASIRSRLFARPTEVCPVLPPELRSRFRP